MDLNIRVTRRRGDGDESIEISLPYRAALVGGPGSANATLDSAERHRLEWSGTLCDGKRVTFAEAERACAAMGAGWRLPDRPELESILDLSRYDPAIDPERFPDTKSGAYWTRTAYAPDSSCAWIVYFYNGYSRAVPRDGYRAFVRACRVVPAGQ